MATKTVSIPAPPRLYLATLPLTKASPAPADLSRLLAEFDIAAVLVRLAPADSRDMTACIKALAPPVQAAGTALLIEGHPELVARAGADGAHLSGIEAMQDALPSLKPDRIVGVGALQTRHDAMVAAEAGADYVMFGEPANDGERPSPSAIAERLQWWAEVFEPPCVGYALTLEEVGSFAGSGADFILVADMIWDDPRGPAAALADVAATISQAHADAFGHPAAKQG